MRRERDDDVSAGRGDRTAQVQDGSIGIPAALCDVEKAALTRPSSRSAVNSASW